MDLKKEIANETWISQLYKTKECIDFSKINDDDSQAKLTLFLMEVAQLGSRRIISEGCNIIHMLEYRIESLGNSKEEHEEIEGINSDIQKIHKAISSCEEAVEKIKTERNEIIKRFWSEEWERGIIIVPKFENKKREFDLSKEKMQKLRDPSPQELSLEEIIEKILTKAFKRLENYSPFNDPDNKYGWKEYCNIRRKLHVHSLEESLKRNKTMQVTDDKQYTPPRSGDRGTESKENSLSPLNSSNESKGSSVPKDSGISSDETSTSPERKGVKIDYSKVKKTLERLMGTDPYLDSKLLSDSYDGRVTVQSRLMWNMSHDYEVLVKRALLDFCERHLLNPPDDYLLLGLGYVKFKQSNVVLTN